MDQKTWLRRKRSSEKTIVSIGDEIQSNPDEKEFDMENSLKTLNEKLASVLDECSAKDKLVQDYEKQAENAIADKQKAEDEVRRLKAELDEAHKQKVAANERLVHINTALKDSMEQLKTSNESEKAHKKLEQKLSDTTNNLASLTAENSYLIKALLVKEKLIDDLNKVKYQKESEFGALMTRLESTEKENVFLRYEFRSLETELDRLNDETECARRSLEASHKRNAENVRKIKKLEGECQRPRAVSTRKRLPAGPTVLASNARCLTGQIRELENENRILKERLAKSLSDQLSFASSRSWDHECKVVGTASSEMSLMDDFVEMERLAIVEVGNKSNVLPIITDRNHPAVRDEFKKRLGGAGPGTAFELESVQNLMVEMEKMYLVFQLEIEGLKNELTAVKSSDESQKSIASLQSEIEMLRESKNVNEDEVENLRLINVDLDIQLTVIKSKLNDLIQKLSSVEVELDNKTQCCDELEGTCLKLQLQLARISSNKISEENENQEELLDTGLEITKATVKLAECEQTIMKLGKQLKSLGSTNQVEAVEKVNLSITDTKKKTLKQRSSLRDQMICEDSNAEGNDPQQSPKTKEIISTTNGNTPPVSCNNTFSFPDGQVATPNKVYGNKNADIGALVVVPMKKRIGFLRKLMLTRKQHKGKNIYFGK